MNYYERHIGDYLKDTAHLSLLEHGVYGRLLDVYYTRECAIPEGEVARLVGARSKEERAALNVVLTEFFELTEAGWGQSRCDREIARYQDKQRKAKASAEKRWQHTERKADAMPTHMPTHTEGNAPRARPQTPDTRHQPTEAKLPTVDAPKVADKPLALKDLVAEGVEAKVAADWLAVRRAKKCPLTPTAWEAVKREAQQAGITPAQAVKHAAEGGWQGFKAAWVQRDAKRTDDVFAGMAV